MKLTWFGGTALRLYIGGQILVVDPETALPGVDKAELLSGADRTLSVSDPDLEALDLTGFRPRRAQRLIDDVANGELAVWRLGVRSALVEAAGEPQVALVVADDPLPPGAWIQDCVVVLFGLPAPVPEGASSLLADRRPRLIALALGDDEIGGAMFALQDLARHGAVLMTLEPEMAVEL